MAEQPCNYAEESARQPASATGRFPIFAGLWGSLYPSWWLFFLGLLLPLLLPWSQAGLVLASLVASTALVQKHPKIQLPLIAGLIISGFHGVEWASRQLPEACWRVPVVIEGRVATIPVEEEVRTGQRRVRFEFVSESTFPQHCDSVKRVRLSDWTLTETLALGQRRRLEVALRPPPSQLSPGAMPDQARYSAARIDAMGTVRRVDPVVLHAPNKISILRTFLADTIDHSGVSSEARGLLKALVIGDGSDVAVEDWQRFQRLGLIHVLVISGLHIGLVYLMTQGLAAGIINCLPSERLPKWVFIRVLAVGASLLYALLAGFSVPTQRAMIMITVMVVPRLFGWQVGPWTALRCALALILVTNPFAVVSESLWLSVVATGILISLASGQGSQSPCWRFDYWWKLLLLQAQLALLMMPLTLFWFSGVSISAILVNVVIVPVISLLVVPLAMLGVVWAVIWSRVQIIGIDPGGSSNWPSDNVFWEVAAAALDHLRFVLITLDDALRNWGYLEFELGLVLAGALVILLSAVFLVFKRRFIAGLVGGSLCALVFALVQTSVGRVEGAQLVLLDVGQGLAVVWREGNRTLLYDTGASGLGAFTQAEKIIMPYFAAASIRQLDVMVVSHSDDDHSGGMVTLNEALSPGRWLGFGGEPCRAGERVDWPGETRITLLNGTGQALENSNDSSCVLLLQYGDFRVLLTGDISMIKERELVRYWRDTLEVDVLVVGHHGSDTSSGWSFLKWTKPDYALISAGRANRFSHPRPTVIDRLRNREISTWNTARMGTITVEVSTEGRVRVDGQRKGQIPYWLSLP